MLSQGEFRDGNSIGKRLNISRTAVWKFIKKLEAYGIEVQSVRGRGYALPEPLLLLNAAAIRSQLNTPITVDVLESTRSTITTLQPFVHDQQTRVCIAEQQTQGVGRFGRAWQSPFGKNIYFSMLYRFEQDMSELSGLSLVAALALNHTLTNHCGFANPPKIKWPNDIFCSDKKLAGSLIQIHAETNGFCSVIISAGINVNMRNDTNHTIDQSWTSVVNETDQYTDRNALCAQLINTLTVYLERFEQHGLSAFLDEWHDHDYLLNKDITLQSSKNQFIGKACGINALGHLTLNMHDNEIKAFSSGDTSIINK